MAQTQFFGLLTLNYTAFRGQFMDGLAELHTGDRVIDSDSNDDDPNTAVVVKLRDKPITDITMPETDITIADYNPEYDESEPGVTVIFEGDLDKLDEWKDVDPDSLYGRVMARSIKTYTYPWSRLVRVDAEG